jgi:2,4-dienoyl-CoA reductase-like NADH-dependent reductase (Old Yellow Enzyme family)
MSNSTLSISLQTTSRCEKNNFPIPSRFYLAPINTGLAPNGKPNERFVEFYKKRSGRSIGITYIGNVSIGKAWCTSSNTPWISYPSRRTWEQLSSAIEKNGSVPGIQLACRSARKKPFKGWTRNNPNAVLEDLKRQFCKIDIDVMHRIKESFIGSARLSLKLGFKVIQLHAAHGYFLSQLLDDRINTRGDIYGADPLGLIRELIACIRNQEEHTFIDLRLSLFDGFEHPEVEFTRKSLLLDQILKTQIDIISFSNGTYDFNKQFIYPPIEWGHGPFIKDVTPLAKKYPDIIFNIAGNIWDIRKIPTNIPENLSFSIARALIADPELIEKSIYGHFDQIAWCVRKGSCHYYTKGCSEIYCPLDPSLIAPPKFNCECSKWISGAAPPFTRTSVSLAPNTCP